MRPSLSVAVIKSHVRIGIEKAHELNLPQAIIDIIAQHHGRGLITYFYHRAMKEGKNPRSRGTTIRTRASGRSPRRLPSSCSRTRSRPRRAR